MIALDLFICLIVDYQSDGRDQTHLLLCAHLLEADTIAISTQLGW